MHKAIASEEGKEFILQAVNEKEQFRFIFAYFSKIIDRTKPVLDLEERRKLPDVMGEYLHSYDAIASMKEADRNRILKEILMDSPEFKRIPELNDFVSEEMISEAFEQAEIEGAEQISLEDTNEDY